MDAPTPSEVIWQRHALPVFKYSKYTVTQWGDFSGAIAGGTFCPVELVRSGGLIKVLLVGTLAGQVTDTSFTGGRVGVATKNNAATFDNLVVTQPWAGATA